ncbi:DUF2269 domain-containing protein [Streptomyces sp. NPDC006668]|uniref:DUF2269 domain-containing protein n=1 Tax=Streptomyces sp. NPDC006668 TaxID=3156903 RepID=UPI001056A9EA
MTVMLPRLRKPVFTLHVASSVGWFGAAAVYLVLCLKVMTSRDTETVRILYPVLREIVWYVILPFDLLSLSTGLASALLTSTWGLFRHYWVVVKFVLVLGSTLVLLVYTQEIAYYARKAERLRPSRSELSVLRGPDSLEHVVLAMLVLVATMVLAVYKPRGRTRYGRRVEAVKRRNPETLSDDVEMH